MFVSGEMTRATVMVARTVARVWTEGRDGRPDPRDGLMRDLDLPRGEEREPVVDRDLTRSSARICRRRTSGCWTCAPGICCSVRRAAVRRHRRLRVPVVSGVPCAEVIVHGRAVLNTGARLLYVLPGLVQGPPLGRERRISTRRWAASRPTSTRWTSSSRACASPAGSASSPRRCTRCSGWPTRGGSWGPNCSRSSRSCSTWRTAG